MFNGVNKEKLDSLARRVRQLEVFVHDRYAESENDYRAVIKEAILDDEYRFKLLADAIGMEFVTEAAQPSKTVLVKKTTDVSNKEA